MKQFYYFSKNKLKFVEIRNYYQKFVFLVLFLSTLISFIVFGTFYILNEIVNPDAAVKTLQSENRALMNKLSSVLRKYDDLESEINSLSSDNDNLRIAVNLEPVSPEERLSGTGGNIFDEIPISNSEDIKAVVSNLDTKISDISRVINFEKNNYEEIRNTLASNSKLYDAIPAIKPADGPYGDRFGMRRHPILKVRRMHNGLDILVNIGTPVFAPGDGKVVFVGRRGGYGNVVEIDHGFGYKTLFAHLKKMFVKRGQKITRGDKIALSGNTGKLSTGPHLHYEVTNKGIALNPRNFIFDDIKLFDLVKK